MSLAEATRRGRFLKARFGVNGIQYGSRSFGTLEATLEAAFGRLDAMELTPFHSRAYTSNELAAPETGGDTQLSVAAAAGHRLRRKYRAAPRRPEIRALITLHY